MMNAKHTPEPWTIEEWKHSAGHSCFAIFGVDPRDGGKFAVTDVHEQNGVDRENAARLVACVNKLSAHADLSSVEVVPAAFVRQHAEMREILVAIKDASASIFTDGRCNGTTLGDRIHKLGLLDKIDTALSSSPSPVSILSESAVKAVREALTKCVGAIKHKSRTGTERMNAADADHMNALLEAYAAANAALETLGGKS